MSVRTRTAHGADGVVFTVREHGDPAAPGVLLVHGAGSSTTFVEEALGPPLSSAGWRVVAVPLRGHAGSTSVTDAAGHAHDRLVADVVAVARTTDVEVVGGVSRGAHAAVGAVADGLAVRAVVACLPAWCGRAVPGEGPHAAVAAEVRADGIAAMIDRFHDDREMVPWLREVLVRDWARHDPRSLAAALHALDGGAAPTGAELAALRAPLAVVGWPDDPGHPLAVARDWASAAPRGVLRTTSLAAVQDDRTALGRAAVAALHALDVHARERPLGSAATEQTAEG